MSERARIGDRLERAIEERADPELKLEREEAEEPRGRSTRRTLVWLAITGVSLYLVAPALLEVLGSWKDLAEIEPAWLAAMAALQALSLACLWALQYLALHTRDWFAVVTSQLAGNALSRIAPGGGAVGGALQYRMLVQAGEPRGRAASAMTATNLFVFAVVLALPVFALPSFIGGAVNRNLVQGTLIGLGVFALLAAAGALVLTLDGPLAWLGRAVQGIRNRLRRRAEPARTLPQRLLRERNRLLDTLGPQWKKALVAAVARWAFDYATLMAALAAVGSEPRPGLVLLAFCTAQVLTQIPITPGGVGFVEAGLTATLALAGVAPGDAVLATLAYRLVNYWLPLPVGLLAGALHRRRYA